MPELPDILVYREALRSRIVGRAIESVQLRSPFLLRTFEPSIETLASGVVCGIERLGKRLVLEVDDGQDERLLLVLHLMIAGRLRWFSGGRKPPGKITLATLSFPDGLLAITESSPKERAALYLLRGREGLAAHDPGGLDVLRADAAAFGRALRRENHTIKRALTDPRVLDGIGNAYSDEILHAARLSPFVRTQQLDDEAMGRLHAAARQTLSTWTDRLLAEFAGRFPAAGEITAFRPDFAVHGRFGQPCPSCGTEVQRIRFTDNEINYCPTCQTGGRLLRDRSLSRLMGDDWERLMRG